MKPAYYIIILIVMISCEKSPLDFLIETGPAATETRDVGKFTYITINDVFDIILIPDTAYRIEITGGKNILPYVKTENSDGYLTLSNSINGRWGRKYERLKLSVYLPQLDTLLVNTACNIVTSDSIECKGAFIMAMTDLADINLCLKGRDMYFQTSYSTNGHYVFTGKLRSAFMISGGTSRVDASNLNAGRGIFWNNSVGDMSVRADSISDLSNYRDGRILVYGHPSSVIQKHVPDTTKVIFVE